MVHWRLLQETFMSCTKAVGTPTEESTTLQTKTCDVTCCVFSLSKECEMTSKFLDWVSG